MSLAVPSPSLLIGSLIARASTSPGGGSGGGIARPACPSSRWAEAEHSRAKRGPPLHRPPTSNLSFASGNVGRLPDEDFCADLDAVVEVDHVGVVEAKASR